MDNQQTFHGHRADAGERALVIEADHRELSRLRFDLALWLDGSALSDEAQRDIVLVASELIAKVLDAGQGDEPIEVRCRHTHSLAVIEVAQTSHHHREHERREHEDRHGSGTSIDEALEADAIASDILRSLTSRLTITHNTNRSEVRCTLSLDGSPGGQ